MRANTNAPHKSGFAFALPRGGCLSIDEKIIGEPGPRSGYLSMVEKIIGEPGPRSGYLSIDEKIIGEPGPRSGYLSIDEKIVGEPGPRSAYLSMTANIRTQDARFDTLSLGGRYAARRTLLVHSCQRIAVILKPGKQVALAVFLLR